MAGPKIDYSTIPGILGVKDACKGMVSDAAFAQVSKISDGLTRETDGKKLHDGMRQIADIVLYELDAADGAVDGHIESATLKGKAAEIRTRLDLSGMQSAAIKFKLLTMPEQGYTLKELEEKAEIKIGKLVDRAQKDAAAGNVPDVRPISDAAIKR